MTVFITRCGHCSDAVQFNRQTRGPRFEPARRDSADGHLPWSTR